MFVCRTFLSVFLIGASGVLALGTLATMLNTANAQIQGKATGWCTNYNGVNFRCGTQSGQVGGNRARATLYNNRGVDRLRVAQRSKSLRHAVAAITDFREAMRLQSHWIHQRNLFAALTYYWSLRASRERSCGPKITYMRRAASTMHYYPAQRQRSYLGEIAALQRACAKSVSKGATTARRPQKRSVNIGAAAAVAGTVLQCRNGRCERLASGKTIWSNATIRTGGNGRIQVLFTDETVFTMGPNTEIVLDEYVYDPYTKSGKIDTRVNKGTFRFVSGSIARKRPSARRIRLPTGIIGIRGTDFIVRLNPAARTAIVDLLEGALLYSTRGGLRRPISPGTWVIKWTRGGHHRIARVRAYRGAGDRALARRRAYYNKILPARRPGSSSGGGSPGGTLTGRAARIAVLNPAAPIGRAIHWRDRNGAHGSYTPAAGLYNRGADRCRRVSFIWTRADRVKYAGTGWVCRRPGYTSMQFGVGHMTKVQ